MGSGSPTTRSVEHLGWPAYWLAGAAPRWLGEGATLQREQPQQLKMDELQTLGITLPRPAYIVGVVLFGLIGLAAFRSGRRVERPTSKWLGIALIFYPYAVPQT